MKPFDLRKALAGEPVELRDGSKAYVKYMMPDDYNGVYPLRGIRCSVTSDTNYADVSWTKEGNVYPSGSPRDLDIIGMWEEPRPRVQLDLPCPLKEPQEDMWFIHNGEIFKSDFTLSDFAKDPERLEIGIYFASEEDANEWINAMKEARR